MLGRSVATTAAVVPVTAAAAAVSVFIPFVSAVAVAAAIHLPVIVPVVAGFAVMTVPLAMIAGASLVPVGAVDVPIVTAFVPAPVVLFVAGTLLVLGRLGRARS